MSKPLSTFDYLLDKDKKDTPLPARAPQAPIPQNFPSQTADPLLAEAWTALAMPILTQLRDAPDGKLTMFQLVEKQKFSVDDLRPVLDQMADRHSWIALDKSDLKGDWAVSLTSRGRDYLQKYAR
jgi:hypothetical protein